MNYEIQVKGNIPISYVTAIGLTDNRLLEDIQNYRKVLLELRKQKGMSQEEVAEKINVTRQTISKWELEETTLDIKQAKSLAKLYNISLDELLDNKVINNKKVEISNTEKLAGIVIKVIKILGILFLIYIILMILRIIVFSSVKSTKTNNEITKMIMTCTLKDEVYSYTVEYDENNKIISAGGDTYLTNILDLEKYQYADQIRDKIEEYFKNNNGTCD